MFEQFSVVSQQGAVLKATNYTDFHELKIFLFPYSIDYQDKTISVN